jgi:hypothetical protein
MVFAAESMMGGDCLPESGWAYPTQLNINQSGIFLELSFGEGGHSVMPGRLHDLVISAASLDAGDSNESATEAAQVTQIQANVQRDGEDAHRLAGQLVIAGCDEPIPFTATDHAAFQGQSAGGGH